MNLIQVTLVFVIISLVLVTNGSVLKHHFVIRSSENGPAQSSDTDDEWWRTAVFYQIYPRSFMDSNGDGNGDIEGIINKLDHLKDMGVTAAWLSPVYKSPGVDQGYDISDYRDINPIFGNLTDIKNLIKAAHDKGIKIIMDFVPNHTSDKHDWFIKSVQNDTTYRDYYVWVDKPNNWISEFGGSAWKLHSERKQYYLHQFTEAQPDLNFRNPAVIQEMKDILKYWLDLGVDGFRVDAVPFLFEDDQLRDEPLSGADVPPDQYGYLKHIYTNNLNETYFLVYELRKYLDEYTKSAKNHTRIMMTECYTDTAEQTMTYFGDGTHDGAHFTFNFNLITDLHSNFAIDDIINAVGKWMSFISPKYTSNWVLGNHDQHRVATRFGKENVDAFNMLVGFLPGIQVTYMGEEIGMEDGEVTCAQGWDTQATNNCTTFNETSRDFERTPYQWENNKNGGFSSNDSTWLPVSENYKTTNLKDQNIEGKQSHYNVYKSLIKFRNNFKNISFDAVSLIKISDHVLQIIRKTDKGEYLYVFNNADQEESFNMFVDNSAVKVVIADAHSKFKVGQMLPTPHINLEPHEAVILEIANSNFRTTSSNHACSVVPIWTISFILLSVSIFLNKFIF